MPNEADSKTSEGEGVAAGAREQNKSGRDWCRFWASSLQPAAWRAECLTDISIHPAQCETRARGLTGPEQLSSETRPLRLPGQSKPWAVGKGS